MKGFHNRILYIDLDRRETRYEEITDSLLSETLGGKGLGVHLLLRENPAGVDPLDPENRFIICCGPVTGTKMWSQSRFGVYSKSPATGGFGESYCGGSLAPKIKGCGVDALVITGKSDRLLYLTIDENGVEFNDASALKGAETFDAEEYILERSKNGAGAMVIGPAGENLVRIACIKSDYWRSLGRGGLGAVLGSKNIKGISFAGTTQAEVADGQLLKEFIKQIAKMGKESKVTATYQNYGTPSQVAVTNVAGCFPTRYWQSGRFDSYENISADYMQEHFEVKRHGCPNCFLQCTKLSTVKEGRHAGLQIEGPEFETIYSIGGLNCVDSLEEIVYLNDLCDRLGIDTMSAGNLTAFATEAYKLGKIDFEIEYNRPDTMAELLEEIAYRRGIGETFADGIKQASKMLELEDIAVHVKGLEPAGFDPRVLKGMGLSYATSARGACHLRGTFYKAELSGEIPKEQIEGKAMLQIDYEDRAALFDSLVLCRFFRDFIKWDELHTLIKASTGLSFSKEGLAKLANRTTMRTREYNLREGLGSSEDKLPKIFLDNPNKEGALLRSDELTAMIDEYNTIREERYENARSNL